MLLGTPFVPIEGATWAAQYNTWLLIKLTPKGVVFSFLSMCSTAPTHVSARSYKDSLKGRFWQVHRNLSSFVSLVHVPMQKLPIINQTSKCMGPAAAAASSAPPRGHSTRQDSNSQSETAQAGKKQNCAESGN
jgi:hypothetical protein